MQRIDKITVVIEYGKTKINLCRRNQIVHTLYASEIKLPEYDNRVQKTKYINTVKQYVEEMFKKGVIEGCFFQEREGKSSKYDNSAASNNAEEKIVSEFGKLQEDLLCVIMVLDAVVDVTERYKDKYIKYGIVKSKTKISAGGKEGTFNILTEIRSGQMCKPKIEYGDKLLNITNLNVKIVLNAQTKSNKQLINKFGTDGNFNEPMTGGWIDTQKKFNEQRGN